MDCETDWSPNPVWDLLRRNEQEIAAKQLQSISCQATLSDDEFIKCIEYAAAKGCDAFLAILVDSYRVRMQPEESTWSHDEPLILNVHIGPNKWKVRFVGKQKTALHLAAAKGQFNALRLILRMISTVHNSEIEQYLLELLDERNFTALSLACQNMSVECMELLVDKEALASYKYGKDGYVNCLSQILEAACKTQNPQHKKKLCTMAKYLILKQDKERLKSLIMYRPPKSEQVGEQEHQEEEKEWWWPWHQSFVRYLWSRGYCHIHTPLVKLIATLPDAGEVLLSRFIEKNENGEEYNFKFLEMYMCDRTEVHKKLAESSINAFLQWTTQESESGSLNEVSIGGARLIGEEYLERPSPMAQHWPPQGEEAGLGEEYYSIRAHPLNIMTEYKTEDLLLHPLVGAYINWMWNGRNIYLWFYINVLIYLMLMTFLTTYSHFRFHLSDCYCIRDNSTEGSGSEDVYCPIQQDFNSHCDKSIDTYGVLLFAIFAIGLCIVKLIQEALQLRNEKLHYLLSPINHLEIALYVSAIIFTGRGVYDMSQILHGGPKEVWTCTESWIWELGTLSVFALWFNFFLFLRRLPIFGIFIIMFEHVSRTILKASPMVVVLLITFGQPFYFLLRDVRAKDFYNPFTTFLSSMLKALTMQIGEYEADPLLFTCNKKDITYPFSTYLMIVLMIIFVTIILQNMLVGLAVDDIAEIRRKSIVKYESIQIGFILKMKTLLQNRFRGLLCQCNRDEDFTFERVYRRCRHLKGKMCPLLKFKLWFQGKLWSPITEDEVESTLQGDVRRMEVELKNCFTQKIQELQETIMARMGAQQPYQKYPAEKF